MSVQKIIQQTIVNNPVVLFMKGSVRFPQCGFSSRSVKILKDCGLENFLTIDVLQAEDIRQGIKEFSDWPTIPQLYINGEFIGGSDIMYEMFQNGELQSLLKNVLGVSTKSDPIVGH